MRGVPLRNVRFVLPVVVLAGALALTGCTTSPPDATRTS